MRCVVWGVRCKVPGKAEGARLRRRETYRVASWLVKPTRLCGGEARPQLGEGGKRLT